MFSMQVSSAIGDDMTRLFGRNDYSLRRGEIYVKNGKGRDCILFNQSKTEWLLGDIVMNKLQKMQSFKGLSGSIQFDSNGRRTNFLINIYKLKINSTAQKVGTYTNEENGGLLLYNGFNELNDLMQSTQVRKLIVSSIRDSPFLMVNEEKDTNEKYYGYIVDLTEKISKIVNFTYEIRLVKDNRYGEPSKLIVKHILRIHKNKIL